MEYLDKMDKDDWDEMNEEDYNRYLKELYGDKVIICGISYDTAYALKEIDPTVYDVGFADWSSLEE